MNTDRALCATNVLERSGEHWALTSEQLIAADNGHHFHHGWHIGWVWGRDEEHPCFLDILSEHRMAGMYAERILPDGSASAIDVPREFRLVGKTPEEDERLKAEYFEHNRRTYADLRERGLLPPPGGNIGSQDINEYLVSGGEVPKPESDAEGASR